MNVYMVKTLLQFGIVALTGFPIGYSVIVALTGLPIGYSVTVASYLLVQQILNISKWFKIRWCYWSCEGVLWLTKQQKVIEQKTQQISAATKLKDTPPVQYLPVAHVIGL